MAAVQSARNDRIKAAIATGAIQAALALALIAGLQVSRHAAVPDALVLVDLPPETPPPLEKIEPRTADSRAKRSRPSPPNIKSRATEIVAPPPILALALPTPVIAAPVAGFGADRAAGAAPLPGPGTGIGGKGWGDGGGGDGDGLGRGRGTPPRRVRGHIGNGDYPRWAGEAGIGGTVSVRYAVEIDGRVSGCVVTRSSGDAALDEFTCGLIVKRFRFKPSLDASGRPVRSYIVENHDWTIEIDPDPPPEDGR